MEYSEQLDKEVDRYLADRHRPRWQPQLHHIAMIAVLFSMVVIIVFQIRDIMLADQRAMSKDIAIAEQIAKVATPQPWLKGRGPAGEDFLIGVGAGQRIALVDLQQDGRRFVELSYADRCGNGGWPAALLMGRTSASDIGAAVVKPTKIAKTPWLDAALAKACTMTADRTLGVVQLTLGQAIKTMSDQVAARPAGPAVRTSSRAERHRFPQHAATA